MEYRRIRYAIKRDAAGHTEGFLPGFFLHLTREIHHCLVREILKARGQVLMALGKDGFGHALSEPKDAR